MTVPNTNSALDWLRLADGETVHWHGRPRIVSVLPAVVIGCLIALAGGIAGVLETRLFWLAVPVGLLIAAYAVLANRRTWYVITSTSLYKKTGVLGRRVRSVGYERVQNSQYDQSITGTVFGHGSVTVDVAGGNTLRFRSIHDPDQRAQSIRRQRHAAGSASTRPGTREQWLAVERELQAIRQSLDRSENSR
jgi:uncharacterized membrane protein YdbT with pleckstrin-like domain